MGTIRKSGGNSGTEDRFIELFCETFGADKGQYVYLQYPLVDIYGGHRTIDFAVSLPDGRVAMEVDGNTWHQPGKISQEKYHDDLLKQNLSNIRIVKILLHLELWMNLSNGTDKCFSLLPLQVDACRTAWMEVQRTLAAEFHLTL